MNRLKLDFVSNNRKYAIWAWKGNYLNLGAGAEVGSYKQNDVLEYVDEKCNLEHWDIGDSFPMTLSLYRLTEGGNICRTYYNWLPDEKQWWITGFVPDIYDYSIQEEELLQVASVDFSKNPQLLKDLKQKHQSKKKNLIFDMGGNILWIIY